MIVYFVSFLDVVDVKSHKETNLCWFVVENTEEVFWCEESHSSTAANCRQQSEVISIIGLDFILFSTFSYIISVFNFTLNQTRLDEDIS